MANTENKKFNDSNIIIIALLLLFSIGTFFLWRSISCEKNVVSETKVNSAKTTTQATDNNIAKDLSITVIWDKRCWKACQTEAILDQLKLVPELAKVNFEIKDFSDSWVDTLLKNMWITKLPAFIFSNNNVNKDMKWFLIPTKDWKFSLNVGASFDPFAKRSDRGFTVIDKTLLDKIKANSYVKWNKNAKFTWLEYSDLECPFCAKLHNSSTPSDLAKKYGEDLNKVFNHFPLWFHKNAFPAAQVLECVWELNWGDTFYSLIDKSYSEKKSDRDYLIEQAVKLWVNKKSLEKCLAENKFDKKIKDEQIVWADVFGITWTPWNVLINNETGEYAVLSWAYPISDFEKVIDSLK